MKSLISKSGLQILAKLSEPNFCFFICDFLLKNGVHICKGNLISPDGEQLDGLKFLPYYIQKLLYESNMRYKLDRNLEQLVANYEYIFLMELGNNDALVAMLAA